jgi:uncharacterized coiled-coil DUF342 family protein
MCIICNCGDDGDEFLTAHSRTSGAMQEAKDAMLKCSQTATDPAVRKRYDAMHKKITRMLRDWNRIEQERESGAEGHSAGAAS